jgi:hypothetical protein
MASFVISYDLNGPTPTHTQMDEFIRQNTQRSGRILESVWWVDFVGTSAQLRDRLLTILCREDSVMVCKCQEAAWHNLLVQDAPLKQAIEAA